MPKAVEDRLRAIATALKEGQAQYWQAIERRDRDGHRLSVARSDRLDEIRHQDPSLSFQQVVDLRDRLPESLALVEIDHACLRAQEEIKHVYNDALNFLANWPELASVRDRMLHLSPHVPSEWQLMIDLMNERIGQSPPLQVARFEPPREDAKSRQELQIEMQKGIEPNPDHDELSNSEHSEKLREGTISVMYSKAAEYLGVTEDHIRRLVREKKLLTIGQGQHKRITTESLRKYKGT